MEHSAWEGRVAKAEAQSSSQLLQIAETQSPWHDQGHVEHTSELHEPMGIHPPAPTCNWLGAISWGINSPELLICLSCMCVGSDGWRMPSGGKSQGNRKKALDMWEGIPGVKDIRCTAALGWGNQDFMVKMIRVKSQSTHGDMWFHGVLSAPVTRDYLRKKPKEHILIFPVIFLHQLYWDTIHIAYHLLI